MLIKTRLSRMRYVFLISALRTPWISFGITTARFLIFRILLRRKVRAWHNLTEDSNSVDYSRSAVDRTIIRPLTRSVLPISLASSLFWPEPFDKKLLIIGPRFESDYFLARGYGFSKNNITLIDLFSYSKLIRLGDSHGLNFTDGTFDVVIASWVLVYSNNHPKMLSEIRRVLKTKTGIAIISGDYAHSNHQFDLTDRHSAPYIFSADHIIRVWPKKDDTLIMSWPTSVPTIESTPQVLVAIQKGT